MIPHTYIDRSHWQNVDAIWVVIGIVLFAALFVDLIWIYYKYSRGRR